MRSAIKPSARSSRGGDKFILGNKRKSAGKFSFIAVGRIARMAKAIKANSKPKTCGVVELRKAVSSA